MESTVGSRSSKQKRWISALPFVYQSVSAGCLSVSFISLRVAIPSCVFLRIYPSLIHTCPHLFTLLLCCSMHQPTLFGAWVKPKDCAVNSSGDKWNRFQTMWCSKHKSQHPNSTVCLRLGLVSLLSRSILRSAFVHLVECQ